MRLQCLLNRGKYAWRIAVGWIRCHPKIAIPRAIGQATVIFECLGEFANSHEQALLGLHVARMIFQNRHVDQFPLRLQGDQHWTENFKRGFFLIGLGELHQSIKRLQAKSPNFAVLIWRQLLIGHERHERQRGARDHERWFVVLSNRGAIPSRGVVIAVIAGAL